MNEFSTEELLNAYVDGELSPADHARMARAIALNPELARRVAVLTSVKSALSGLAAEPDSPVHLTVERRPRTVLGVAASIALLAVILGSMSGGFFQPDGHDHAWYREAAALHAKWVAEPAAPDASEVDTNYYLASLDRLNMTFKAPDLTSAKLRLTYLKFYEAGNGYPAALHLGYTGRHGCRLTLWVTATPQAMGAERVEPVELRDGATRSFHWRQGATAYALFATGMAEGRFTTIAEKIYESTRKMQGFDDETRMALRDTSGKAPPCTA